MGGRHSAILRSFFGYLISSAGKTLAFCCLLIFLSPRVLSQSSVDSLKALLQEQVQDTTRIGLLNELSHAYTYSSGDSALAYATQALTLARNVDFAPGIAQSQFQLTLIYRLAGNYTEALDNGFEALKYYTEAQQKPKMAGVLTKLGGVYFRLQDFDKAFDCYQQSLKIHEELGDEIGQATQFVGLGLVYENTSQFEKAMTYYQQALAINRRNAPPYNIAVNLVNIGDLLLIQHQYQEALPYFFESLEINRKINNLQGVAAGTKYLARLYQETGDLQKSIDYALTSLEVAQQIKRKVIASESSLILSKNYAEIKDYRKALEFYHLHTAYNDSIYNAAKIRELSSLESSYEMQKKEQEIKIQEQTIGLLNRDRKIDRLWRNILAGGLMVLALFGFLFYKFQRLRNRKNAQLLATQLEVTEKLQELDRSKSRFFANISHEFRTPLTLIMGPLNELHDGKYQGDPRNMYGLMRRSGKRLLGLINQLLDLSKIESGKMVLKPGKYELVAFLRPILACYDSLAESRLINFEIKTPAHPVWLYFDADKLEKIVHNLVSNAFKFTEVGASVKVEVMVLEKEVHIIITDTGQGIPRDQLEHVFDRFYQVDSSLTRENEGTGIGLALAKELVELHKGKIEVESQEQEGSIFMVSLQKGKDHLLEYDIQEEGPYKYQLSQEEVITDTNGSAMVHDTDSTMEVLIVEDNSDMRQFLKHTLEPSYKVHEAVDGMEGWNAAVDSLPDLIISDVMMPKMDGVELCEKLKKDQRTSHIPVILLTAKVDKQSKLAGLEIGADDYLAKPFDSEELLILLKNRIEQRQKLRERFSKEITLQPKDITITSADERFLQQALDIVEQHMGDFNFNVKMLREEMGISRMQLQRKIKALTDQSPVEFIRVLRLKRAAQLISQRKDNISQITYEVGFNNLSYFAKCFKEHFGQSPSQYASQKVVEKS